MMLPDRGREGRGGKGTSGTATHVFVTGLPDVRCWCRHLALHRRRLGRHSVAEKGQSTAEFAIVLPVLIIMMVLVAESGFLLRNCLLVSSANREAARFAARGRYSDSRVGERAVVAGGVVNRGGKIGRAHV